VTRVAESLALVRSRIPAGVTLIAVSKSQPAEAVREAYAAGQRDFGENYAQEWREKARELSDLPGLTWHFIGALQSNKVKYLMGGEAGAGRASWIHTVDRLPLALEISKRSARLATTTRLLIEVNLGLETAKSGCAPGEVAALVHAMRALPGTELRGLMAIPPATADPRPHFAALRELRDGLELALPDLSMGMSADYEAAIAEGATLVRIGTAIFGERSPATTKA
jgi:PLP dependent protein